MLILKIKCIIEDCNKVNIEKKNINNKNDRIIDYI